MTIGEFIYIALLTPILLIVFLLVFYELRSGAVALPSSRKTRRAILDLLAKHLDKRKSYNMTELGSGWGHVCFDMAREFPKVRITGYEISVLPYRVSRFFNRFKDRISFKKQSFFDDDLGQYDVIFCYLFPSHIEQLKAKFEKELKKGTIIVSNEFPVKGWTPIDTMTVREFMDISVFVYRIG